MDLCNLGRNKLGMVNLTFKIWKMPIHNNGKGNSNIKGA